MANGPKVLVIIGIVLILTGLLWQFGGKFFPFGKLPGDIVYKKENFTFYFPLVSSIILSILLTLIFSFFNKK